MQSKILVLGLLLLLSGCVQQSGMPLGDDKMLINISAPPAITRAEAYNAALMAAAKNTLENGYDKFSILNEGGWNETEFQGGSHGSFSANPYYASGYSNSGFFTTRNPEIKMTIRMYKKGQKGASKALDARNILDRMKKNATFVLSN